MSYPPQQPVNGYPQQPQPQPPQQPQGHPQQQQSTSTLGPPGRLESRADYLETMTHFWKKQLETIEMTDFKNAKHQLPLARIKKIMKSDEDVRMISAEAPVLFAKACELFILDLTMRAWAYTDDNKRRTLQRSDVAEAIAGSEMFDFLVDIVPREENPNPDEGGTPIRRADNPVDLANQFELAQHPPQPQTSQQPMQYTDASQSFTTTSATSSSNYPQYASSTSSAYPPH